jgi:hypothetical protein
MISKKIHQQFPEMKYFDISETSKSSCRLAIENRFQGKRFWLESIKTKLWF